MSFSAPHIRVLPPSAAVTVPGSPTAAPNQVWLPGLRTQPSVSGTATPPRRTFPGETDYPPGPRARTRRLGPLGGGAHALCWSSPETRESERRAEPSGRCRDPALGGGPQGWRGGAASAVHAGHARPLGPEGPLEVTRARRRRGGRGRR